jgi:hypothetical protein
MHPFLSHLPVRLKTTRTPVLLLAALAAILGGRLQGADWQLFGPNLPAIEFHGFVSQGFLASSSYNYLGNTTHGSFAFTEAGLNAAFNPFPRTRIRAQAFTYDVGDSGKYDAVLDYALAEYTFNDYFGVRAGRIRRPQGIYNDIQDVDLARTYVLLPQGVYDARYRDFYVALDGGEFFGTIPLKSAGSLSYEAYGGLVRPSDDGGIALQVEGELPPGSKFDSIGSGKMFGLQLWWNTPVDGLRFGASGAFASGFDTAYTLQGATGPLHVDGSTDTWIQQYSAEYVWKAWTFQTECLFRYTTPATPPEDLFSWYAGAAYRFNKWLEVGSYYTESYPNIKDTNGAGLAAPSDASQKDLALAVRFDMTERWLFKVEGHYIHGTALLQDNSENPDRRNNAWWMLAVKSTISF